MKQHNRNLIPRFMLVLWIISIFFVVYLSLDPHIKLPLDIKNIDKVYHFLMYVWLAAVPFFGFQRLKMALTGACLMLPMGIALEYAQRFVQGRSFSVADMVANTIGVILGVVLGRFLRSRLASWEHEKVSRF